jgi:hypothetical protein
LQTRPVFYSPHGIFFHFRRGADRVIVGGLGEAIAERQPPKPAPRQLVKNGKGGGRVICR